MLAADPDPSGATAKRGANIRPGVDTSMRALRPGSVSSFLKIILDVDFAALTIGVGVTTLLTLASLWSLSPTRR
jgi:hypothetical protein